MSIPRPNKTIVLHPLGRMPSVASVQTPWDVIDRSVPGRIQCIVGGKVVFECKSPSQALQPKAGPKRPEPSRVGFTTRALSVLTLGRFVKFHSGKKSGGLNAGESGFDHRELRDSLDVICQKIKNNPKVPGTPEKLVGKDVLFTHSFQTPVALEEWEQAVILQGLKYDLLSDTQVRDILFAITISPFSREQYDSIHWNIARAKKVLREKIANM